MTCSYKELIEQANQLMAQAELEKQKEIGLAIDEIKSIMKTHGITLITLREAGVDTGITQTIGKHPTTTPPKYQGPNGELWSGGRGRKPDWALKAIQENGDLEAFLIKP